MSKKYVTPKSVRQRYGGRSEMWLWRLLRNDPRFPKPVKINGQRLFDEARLDAYDELLEREAEVAA